MNLEENINYPERNLPDKYKELFKGNHFNFIKFGRLTMQRGRWFLIRRFRRVVDQHKNARLLILGEGSLIKDLVDLSINSI